MGYRKNLTNPYLYKQFSNSPQEMFNYTMTNLMDSFYDTALSEATDGAFKAVCLSGIRTEDNNGDGKVDDLDAEKALGYLNVIVRPLTPFGGILPDPAGMTDPNEINQIISLHASVFTARSDFEAKNMDAPKFGEILNCYFEQGSISNSDFRGLRFSKTTGTPDFNNDYKKLADVQGVVNIIDKDWSGASLLGEEEFEFVGPPNLYNRPATPSEKLSQKEKLDSLDPRMKPKIEKVLKSLKDQGFQPKIYFAWRSLIEQKEIVEKGNSKVYFSFHTAYKDGKPNAYAVDIIDKRWAWTPAAETNGFWTALGKAGKKEKLYWGGDWKDFPDWAHLQFYDNNKLRQVCTESGLPTDFQIRVKK